MSAGPAGGTRAEFRAFVRTHHPDVGGDPEMFRAGLAAFRDVARTSSCPSGAGRLADDDPRLDVPVTVAPDPALRRLGRAGRRLLRRHPIRRGSHRVL